MGTLKKTLEIPKKKSYNQWTEEETDELLKLLVETTLQHQKDKNGAFTKKTVEEKILPKLNQICECNRTYENFKGKYRCSGFGWNKDLKMIDDTEEMWEDYLEVECMVYLFLNCVNCHPNHSSVRLENGTYYGYLLPVFGNKCATGKSQLISLKMVQVLELLWRKVNIKMMAKMLMSMHVIVMENSKEKAKEREDRKIEKEIRRLETDKKENKLWDIVYAMSEIMLEQKLKVIEMLDSNHKKNIFRRSNAEERKLWIASKLRE
ncbi:uncharacterized protein At2g29880-like [Papaver somniferum]|uniref:uncharacterized protein At2g29880-like n=1 Tax=Papaver somniferum TaxID=3469 RepID=UPI000E6FBF01|nr:uncharacterized protein At2g29880-like [Papaver somniferum]